MSWLWIGAASFAGALLSALGMGGGGILLMVLTAYMGMDQLAAQGINLLFFLPVGGAALILHHRNKLVRWETALPCALLGIPGALAGIRAAGMLGSPLLTKLFGGFLLVIGCLSFAGKEK